MPSSHHCPEGPEAWNGPHMDKVMQGVSNGHDQEPRLGPSSWIIQSTAQTEGQSEHTPKRKRSHLRDCCYRQVRPTSHYLAVIWPTLHRPAGFIQTSILYSHSHSMSTPNT